MSQQAWYIDGLRFECTGCGACCTGAPGYVWVNQAEMIGLADAMNVSLKQFQRRYTRRVGIRYSLTERPGGDCVFFDPERRVCRVYDIRPRQCRTWPFWGSNIRTANAWQEMARECPGADRGRLFTPEEIHRLRDVLRI